MARILVVALAFLSLALMTGCSTFTITAARPYFESDAQPEIDRDTILHAARRVVTRMGWTVVAEHAESHRLSAVTVAEPAMRDRLSLEVGEHGEIRLWVRTEMLDESGHWIAPATVCDSYTFSREHQIAERISRSAARHQHLASQ